MDDVYRHENRLRTVVLKNQHLAEDLEKACTAKNGVITYPEYLQLEQFGPHGYHATHEVHGDTDIAPRWCKPLSALAEQLGTSQIIEVGFGNGDLAVGTIKEANLKGRQLHWTGIEARPAAISQVLKKFEQEGLSGNINQIVASPSELNVRDKCVVVFPYSLDSIPPSGFVRLDKKTGPATHVIGISVKNGILQEVFLTEDQMRSMGLLLAGGIYTEDSGTPKERKFDISSWILYPDQRAYLPIGIAKYIYDISAKVPSGSRLVIIDEFRRQPTAFDRIHKCKPKTIGSTIGIDLDTHYQKAGEDLLYYPMYLTTLWSILGSAGYEEVGYGNEVSEAKILIGEKVTDPLFSNGPRFRDELRRVDLRYYNLTSPKDPEKAHPVIYLIEPEPYQVATS